MALLGGLAVTAGRRRRSAGTPSAALGEHAEQIECGRQPGVGRAAQCSTTSRLLASGRRSRARQRQGIAERALRAAGGGRALVPAMRLLQVAHRPRGRRSGCSRAPPARRRSRPRPPCAPMPARSSKSGSRRLDGREQAGPPGRPSRRRRAGPGHGRTACELGLRLDKALVGGALQPARAFGAAGRHAGAFEIAAADAVFRLGDARPGPPGSAAGRPADVALFREP